MPPAGFVPKELPKDATIAVGPALLTENFSTDKDGVVLAHFVFDTVKRRYTVAEATELRNEVADLIDGPAILVNFEPEGAALLRDGKVKEALASYRALIAQHPNSAVHHLQVANVLLEAGMGEAARDEARLAVKLDPNSALAERTLADILKHDLVGRNLRAGSDLAGAADAYRAAIKLDPDDHSAQGDLAHSARIRLRGPTLQRTVAHEGSDRRIREAGPGQAGRSRASATTWPLRSSMAAIMPERTKQRRR